MQKQGAAGQFIPKDMEMSIKILNKKRIVAFSKADLVEEKELKKLKKKKLKNYDGTLLVFSSASGYGIPELKDYLWANLKS